MLSRYWIIGKASLPKNGTSNCCTILGWRILMMLPTSGFSTSSMLTIPSTTPVLGYSANESESSIPRSTALLTRWMSFVRSAISLPKKT